MQFFSALNKSLISFIISSLLVLVLISKVSKISLTLKGPQLKKNGLDIITFNKANVDMLSKIIADYFLSTIVADHTASAIFLSSTNASPLYFQTRP